MWLSAEATLSLAGYSSTVLHGTEALQCAEGLIEDYTGCFWGEVRTLQPVRVRLDAAYWTLPMPRDVMLDTAPGIYPVLEAGMTLRLSPNNLEQYDPNGLPVVWKAGQYIVQVSRGFAVIPQDVVKAASLLAAWYLGLSDPDRSRYSSLSMGDFSGVIRLAELPVPEAQAILARYRTRVRVGVA
jgi:hypothetical protein